MVTLATAGVGPKLAHKSFSCTVENTAELGKIVEILGTYPNSSKATPWVS